MQADPMRIFGVILAGGSGLRMGGADKALLFLGRQRLVDHVVARLRPQVEALAISANGAQDRFADLDLPVLPDQASRGPLSGVLAGLHWAAAAGASHLVSAAVDTPFLPCDLVPRLCLAAEGHAQGFSIARAGGRDHPTFGLWPVTLRDDLRTYLQRAASARVLGFVDMHNAARADFDDPDAFANLNTPDDLAAANARLKAPE
jgi:molybdenum cofactor guanylyltransferase